MRLTAVLALVLVAGVARWGGEARLWWLNRQSLDALRAQALAHHGDPLLWSVYGQHLLFAGQGDEALAVYREAAQAMPSGDHSALAEHVNAHLGYLLARQGTPKEALPPLDFAAKINDDDSLIHVGYGIVFAAQNKFDFAATQFQLAATIDDANTEAWFRLGSAWSEQKQYTEAAVALRHALAQTPGDAACHAELGRVLAAQNQTPAALDEYRAAHRLAPDVATYAILLGTTLAQSAHSIDEYHEAAGLLTDVAKARPDDSDLLGALGGLHLRFNAPALARPFLQAASDAQPDKAENWYALARAETLLGHAPAASSAQARFQTLRTLFGDLNVATKHVASDPHDAAWRLRIAKLYIQIGNLEAARAQYAIAAGLQPDNAETKRAFGDMTQRIARESATRQSAGRTGTLGPPPPPDLVIYDPNNELPAFRPTPDAPPANAPGTGAVQP